MALLYILGGMGILLIHLADVPKAFWLILESAFTPTAAVGGFAGATVKDALRYGIARGLYSNDAGTGYGIIAHASARTDHPVRQASWGWGEVFLDTIVVCSVTALSIILTNVYVTHPGVDSARLTTVAFRDAYGILGLGSWPLPSRFCMDDHCRHVLQLRKIHQLCLWRYGAQSGCRKDLHAVLHGSLCHHV